MADKLPSERQVLRAIYDMYIQAYPYKPEDGEWGQVMVPIDVAAVATKLNVNKYLLYGYLATHLDHKYAFQTGENSFVRFFAPVAGKVRHAVNLPYLSAILAERDQEHSKFAWSLGVSLIALALAVGAILAQLAS